MGLKTKTAIPGPMVDIPSAAEVKQRLTKAAAAVKTAAVEVSNVVAEEAKQMRASEGDTQALKADAQRAATRVKTVVRKAAKKVAKVAQAKPKKKAAKKARKAPAKAKKTTKKAAAKAKKQKTGKKKR